MASTVMEIGAPGLLRAREQYEGRPASRGTSALSVMGRSGGRLALAAECVPETGTVSGIIGRVGGVLILGRHVLTVTAGAVTAPTKFAMTRLPGAALRLRLTAGRREQNDMGSAGFRAPVSLSLSFHGILDLPPARSGISIIHFITDTLVEELVTEVRVNGKGATAELPHFSLFGLAWP